MIKIEHINGDKKLVTKGAFESVFKPLGYKQSINKKETKVDDIKVDSTKKDELTGNEENKEQSDDYSKFDDKNKRK